MICVPEAYKIVRVLNTTAAASFTLSDYISCKNVHRVWFVISHQGAGDTDLTLALDEATTVAGTTHAAVTATFPIWKDTDHGTTSDALVRQTDAASDVIDPATEGGQLTVFEWDPAMHTAGYDCIAVSGSGGHANNHVEVFAIIDHRYPGNQSPTVLTD